MQKVHTSLLCCTHRFKTCVYSPSQLRSHSSLKVKNTTVPSLLRTVMASYHNSAKSEARDDVRVINLRSDTFTLPTAAMKHAMVTAPLGDDVYGEDPTVNKLQEECAALLGKEAALLVPSGTMGNIAAMLTHCSQRFQEVLLGDKSHIFLYEVGGIAALAGVQPHTVKNNPDGTLDLNDLQAKIRDRYDSHYPLSSVICLENTHNKCGGKVLSLDYMKKVRELADTHNLLMHLDGARLMNAACALEVPASHIAQYFDSISMCFSKGLSCPVGSILAGSKEFIARANRSRKALGGGMRQAGVIAAPMLVALTDIVPLLKEDHARARRIAQAVADLGNKSALTVDIDPMQSNILLLHSTRSDIASEQVCQRLKEVTEAEFAELGERIHVLTVPFSDTSLRLVTYHGITDEDVDKSIKKLRYVLTEMMTD